MDLEMYREKIAKGREGMNVRVECIQPFNYFSEPSAIHQVYLNGQLIEAEQFHENDGSMAVLMQILTFCNERTSKDKKRTGQTVGNLLLDFAAMKGFHKKLFEKLVPQIPLYRMKSRPWITATIIRLNGQYRLVTQDEPERLLDLCDKVLLRGKPVILSLETSMEIQSIYRAMADSNSQVIVLAYKDLEGATLQFDNIFQCADFTLVGMIGLR